MGGLDSAADKHSTGCGVPACRVGHPAIISPPPLFPAPNGRRSKQQRCEINPQPALPGPPERGGAARRGRRPKGFGYWGRGRSVQA